MFAAVTMCCCIHGQSMLRTTINGEMGGTDKAEATAHSALAVAARVH